MGFNNRSGEMKHLYQSISEYEKDKQDLRVLRSSFYTPYIERRRKVQYHKGLIRTLNHVEILLDNLMEAKHDIAMFRELDQLDNIQHKSDRVKYKDLTIRESCILRIENIRTDVLEIIDLTTWNQTVKELDLELFKRINSNALDLVIECGYEIQKLLDDILDTEKN